jgi:hypothetical protein
VARPTVRRHRTRFVYAVARLRVQQVMSATQSSRAAPRYRVAVPRAVSARVSTLRASTRAAQICSSPPAQGQQCGSVNSERYYYNLVSRTCTTFNYQGCDTSGNNFGTLAQCQNFCNSAGALEVHIPQTLCNCSLFGRRDRVPRSEHPGRANMQSTVDEQLSHRLHVSL